MGVIFGPVDIDVLDNMNGGTGFISDTVFDTTDDEFGFVDVNCVDATGDDDVNDCNTQFYHNQ
jgi:hypothetical protein